MTDGSHLGENQRNVNQMHSQSINNGHNSSHSMTSMNANLERHSVDSNYLTTHYEPQYHDSSDSQNRYKYRSSGLSNTNITTVSETVTHVSETDNSLSGQNNFGTVDASVASINVPQNYPFVHFFY
jgi:hypothetical protein